MTKQDAIDTICSLYPIDSDYPESNAIGRTLLEEAIEESGLDWRTLPEEVLIRYAEKCMSFEAMQEYLMKQKYR